jgi:plasmid stabilization system protein ParE
LKRTVRFTAKAEHDVAKAYSWYAKERESLGRQFMQRVDEAVEQISENATLYAPLIDDVRRVLLKQFPFALWYRVEKDAIVIACLHGKRDRPASIRRALENPEP